MIKSRIKQLTAFFVAAIMLFPAISAKAYELPSAFWPLADEYAAAKNSNNHKGIVTTGSKIVNLLKNEPKNNQVKEILGSKYYDMGYSYEALGGAANYVKAGECFTNYLPYGQDMGWTDGVKIAKHKSMHFTPDIRIFTPSSDTNVYYGAVNEPKKGVLYGQVSERFRSNESMILIYLEYGQSTDFSWPNHIFSEARSDGKAIELALNFPREGNQLSSIISDTSYINSLIRFLKEYDDIPVFLRIGAEFNIWTYQADPGLYKKAFRKIADDIRYAGLDNIAIVWSASHASQWTINIDDFYPGDEYVDWVGISAYCNRYFGGREWSDSESHNPVVFNAGDAADPVMLIKDIVDRYGHKKPIMLAECGVAYYTAGSMNRYSTDWAVTKLRSMYSMIPIVYPQVKLIAYFNTDMNEVNSYDLTGCAEINSAYNDSVKWPWFIQNNVFNNVKYSYKEITSGVTAQNSLTLYAYPHIYTCDKPKVNYYINEKWVASTSDYPYDKTIDLSGYDSGTYTLTAEAEGGGYTYKKNFTLNINGSGNVQTTQKPTPTQQPTPKPTPTQQPTPTKKPEPTQTPKPVTGNEGSGIFDFLSELLPEEITNVATDLGLDNYVNDLGELIYLTDYEREALSFCQDNGIISGYTDGTIKPYNLITRAEFASMTCRLLGLESYSKCTFSDASDHWATYYIKACVDEGAIAGVGNNRFNPDGNVTYEQAVKILAVSCGIASESKANQMGGYPDGYLRIADSYGYMTGLNDDVKIIGQPLNRISAAVLFYNSQN